MFGKIEFLVADKGYGFIIAEDGREFFFHASACKNANFANLKKDVEVNFELGNSPKGPRAEEIYVV